MIGQTLGRYRIVQKIGEGGMGVVYLARDTRLDRDLALKVLPAGALADEAARKRFQREALALAKLNHPHIAMIFDFDTLEGVDFLVMEYLPGVMLNDRLGSGGLAERETIRLGAQLAGGLAAAHEQGVVHRDLKPGNLRITPDGRLKILDFGLAKLLGPVSQMTTADPLGETQAGAGTLPYMAPEQLRGDSVDARSDIYAAGAVLYEMATGRRPFPETQGPRLIEAILNHVPQAPSAVNRRISSALESIIIKCVDKEPGRRYQSAKGLAADLERLAAPVEAAVTAHPHRSRVRTWGVAATVALVVILAALAGLDRGLRDRLLGGARSPRFESLAVLPLENLSHDPEQEYFADGETEALITELAQISALKVISRTSVMQYKGAKKPLPQIAKELNVDGVVEGTVQRSGDKVGITVQLIHARTDRHLWAKSYVRDLRDVLALQRDVAHAIADEIKAKLTPQEQARLTTARPVNPEAYDAYLRGRYYWNRRPRGLREGIQYFEQAIEKDPSNALAYSGLADSYAALGTWEASAISPENAMPKANAAAIKALELDEALAEAHASLAYIKLHYNWDWVETEKELKRAIELKPRYATAHHWYSHYLMTMGRTRESLVESKRALELDPLDPIINAHQPWHYYYAREYDQDIKQCRMILATDPNSFWAHFELGRAYEQKAMFEQAIPELNRANALNRDMTFAIGALGHTYAMSGQKNKALKVLEQLKELAKQSYVSAADLAIIYVGLGEKDQAFRWLQKAYSERSWYMVLLKVDPRLDPLRSDPRFRDLVHRLGMPP